MAARKGSKTNGSSDASSENQAHDSLLAAEAALEQAIASTLRSLPRSSSLVQMMEGMRLDSAILHEQNDTDLASAADFLKWWREQ